MENGNENYHDNESDFEEEIETMQKVLQTYYNDYSLRLTDIKCCPGSQTGDNYMSIIKRIFVKGTVRKIADFQKSLIIKRQIPSMSRRELFRCDEAFANEISAYRNLVPVLKKFSHNRLPYPNCVFAGSDHIGDIVVLEDLGYQGYKMANRLKGLDFSHCSIVMQELGSLHAISLAMKSTNTAMFNNARSKIKEIVFCPEASEFYSRCLDLSLKGALNSLHLSNITGELSKPIDILQRLEGRLYDIMSRHVLNNDDVWPVVCHGDLWVNNLMFQKDLTGKVSHVKLLDLQTMRYTNPVIDILQFLYSSTEKDIRCNRLNDLIFIYRESLIEHLKIYMLPKHSEKFHEIEKEFSCKNIMDQLVSRVLYGLGVALWLLPAVTFYPEGTPDLNSVTLTDFQSDAQENLIATLHTNEYHIRLKEVVLEFYHKGYLDEFM